MQPSIYLVFFLQSLNFACLFCLLNSCSCLKMMDSILECSYFLQISQFLHIVRFPPWLERERNIFYERKPKSESPKRTIFVSSDLGSLQMVSEPYTRQCVSEEAKPQRGWTRGSMPVKTLGPEGVDWGVPHRLEKGTSASEGARP